MMGTALEKVLSSRGMSCFSVGHDRLEIELKDSVAQVFEAYPADVVFNCVAVVGINPCEENPLRCTKINALGALYVSREAAMRNMTMVQFSTHAVFDGTKDGYYTEDDPVVPTGVYAATKYDSEIYAAMCPKHYVVRVPTMFGPRRNNTFGFADKMISLLQQGIDVRVADDKIDSPTYSIDVAQTIYDILKKGLPHGLYHVANDGSISFYEFITTLREMTGLQTTVHRGKDADFPGLAHKPLKTAMRSVRLSALRPWKEALLDYLQREGLYAGSES